MLHTAHVSQSLLFFLPLFWKHVGEKKNSWKSTVDFMYIRSDLRKDLYKVTPEIKSQDQLSNCWGLPCMTPLMPTRKWVYTLDKLLRWHSGSQADQFLTIESSECMDELHTYENRSIILIVINPVWKLGISIYQLKNMQSPACGRMEHYPLKLKGQNMILGGVYIHSNKTKQN